MGPARTGEPQVKGWRRLVEAEDDAQAMAEYIILVVLVTLPMILVVGPLKRALQSWYTFLATFVGLPIP